MILFTFYFFKFNLNQRNKKIKAALLFLCLSSLVLVSLLRAFPYYNLYKTCYSFYELNYNEIINYDGEEFKTVFKNSLGNTDNKNKNVILFFIEGMSQRVISEKNTPNIYNFQKNTLTFENYYNHTAATFRGIRGQLISGFQKRGGYYRDNQGLGQLNQNTLNDLLNINKIESLPSILNNQGYSTAFVGPHLCEDNLYLITKILGFKHIKGKCNYHENTKNSGHLTDKEDFELLKNTIGELHKDTKPFFVSFYNIETHHGMSGNDYKNPHSDNEYLQKFYNLDQCFGNFIDWLKKEHYLENTIVILTSDHSTFSVNEFEETYNYKSYSCTRFVDRVPLSIYSKNIKSEKIDVKGRNSLGLAPTVLDILGIDNIENHFLGSSLLKKSDNMLERISVVNNVYIYTGWETPFDLHELPEDLHRKLFLFYRYAK